MPPCKHYWLLAIPKGSLRWASKHALARCRHCPAWTVVEYGMPPGPCSHVVGLTSASELAQELTASLAEATIGGKEKGGD